MKAGNHDHFDCASSLKGSSSDFIELVEDPFCPGFEWLFRARKHKATFAKAPLSTHGALT